MLLYPVFPLLCLNCVIDVWFNTSKWVYSVQDIFFHQTIRLWNHLPGSVVEADTLDSFKDQLSRATLM
jgi:hypothetical protein